MTTQTILHASSPHASSATPQSPPTSPAPPAPLPVSPRKVARTGLYRPPRSPVMVDVPAMTYLALAGSGTPWSSLEWAEAVDALHAVAAAVESVTGLHEPGSPLEALVEDGDTDGPVGSHGSDAGEVRWTLLLALPDGVDAEVVARATAVVRDLDGLDAAAGMHRVRLHEAWAAQVMHVGEGPRATTLARLGEFVARHGYLPRGPRHEIYLDDALTTPAELVRTVLRQPVTPQA